MTENSWPEMDGYEAWVPASERGMSRRGCLLWAIGLCAALVLPILVFVQGIGHPGFGVRVTNQCRHEVLFILSGGEPRELRRDPTTIAAGVSEVHSVLAGGDTGGFFALWPADPTEDPKYLTLDHPPSGHDASLVLSGEPCTARVSEPVDDD